MNAKVVNRLAEILGSRKLKISEVSRATGISRSTLTNLYYEKGDAISFEVLNKLCKYLDCNVGDILQLSSEESN